MLAYLKPFSSVAVTWSGYQDVTPGYQGQPAFLYESSSILTEEIAVRYEFSNGAAAVRVTSVQSPSTSLLPL